MNAWIALPTYNERENIVGLLTDLQTQGGVSILVIDDNSPDGTADMVREYMVAHPGVHLLHRQQKTGLGDAYRDGLAWILEQQPDAIVHLDADGSHPPALIPRMLEALAQADLVVASRYVKDGRLSIPWYRRMISLVGNALIRHWLGSKVHDWSTGFKAWRPDLLQTVLRQTAEAHGYAWLIETSWWAIKLGGRVREVPLRFTDRTAGRSKFSWSIMFEDIRIARRLARRHSA
jgi:dolichol-phosphate mannosyltransferase